MKHLFAFFFLALSAPIGAQAETIGKWHSGDVNGFTRYWTTNDVGSNFVVWCHPKRQVNGTLLQFEIEGRMPPPNSRVRVILDSSVLDVPVNEHGYIGTGCPACSDSFGYIWHKIRSSRTLAIKYPDDTYAGFSLKGALNVLPGNVCPTDWEKRKANS
ncbi:hypothetical protein [Roseibium sp.]|uniref:hypothetical protein n=1 Tax=Roseibium sp. TaxID=1936156 RepID=UPI003BACD4FD